MPVHRFAAVLVLASTALTVLAFATPGDGEQPDRDGNQPRQRPVAEASVAPPSPADLAYARMMVVHHAQAVRMSRSLLGRPGVPKHIRLLADFIAHDQQREVGEMTAWLEAWGEHSGGGHDHHGAGDASQGMLSEAQLHALDTAATKDAVPLFLQRMIEHHRGAIVMSRSLLDVGGRNVYIRGLAKHVINEQAAESDAMVAMLSAGKASRAAGA